MFQHFFSRIEVVQEGKDPLPRYDLCGIHMPVVQLIKHQRTQRCDRNMQMWWQRRDSAISSQCADSTFSLTGEDKVECIEGVDTFQYLGRVLERSDENCLEVC